VNAASESKMTIGVGAIKFEHMWIGEHRWIMVAGTQERRHDCSWFYCDWSL